MVTKGTVARKTGRPRVYSDEALFLATARALSRSGYGGLTLESIAIDAGCTRQAIVRRFTSKHGLMSAYLEWVIERETETYRTLRERHSSPLTALRYRFIMPAEDRPSELADAPGQANILSFFLGAREDPLFREQLARLHELYAREVARFVREAQEAGELSKGSPEEIAHLLIAATTGEVVLWTADPYSSIEPRIARLFDIIIAPYLPDTNARAGGYPA
jgi:AcrR family transcriptional regulator